MIRRPPVLYRPRPTHDPDLAANRLAYAVVLFILLQLTSTLCVASIAGAYILDSTISSIIAYRALQNLTATRVALDQPPPTPPPAWLSEPPTPRPTDTPTLPPTLVPPMTTNTMEPPTPTLWPTATPETPTATPTLIPPTATLTPESPTPTLTPLPTYGPNFTVIDLDGYRFASDCPCDQGDTLNCGNFDSGINPAGFGAQACFLRCEQLVGRDVHGLDGDNDRKACEWGG